ncbi:MAG: phosphoesterase [Caulobacter sp.]|jgi:DNA ligase-associated metallophosphoesterase|nr:phosphoesterase [Caulobacter sp.]
MNAQALRERAFSQSPCGGVAMAIHGHPVVMRHSGALWLPAERMLIVADLHFEKGSAYAVRGQLLPPYDTVETLTRLEAEVAATTPATLVFLGDSFHDGRAEDRLSPLVAERIAALASGRTLVWAVGNHDEDGPSALPGELADELAVGTLILRHEPQPGRQPGEIAGHLHPCSRLVGRGRAVRRRCFATDGERVILPAFGAYAGGLNIRDKAYAGLFACPPLAVALGKDKAHPLSWAMLGGD